MMGGGTIFKSVTKSDMLNIELVVPTPEIEDLFEQYAEPVSAQIANLTKKNANMRTTRDLLLPRAATAPNSRRAAAEGRESSSSKRVPCRRLRTLRVSPATFS